MCQLHGQCGVSGRTTDVEFRRDGLWFQCRSGFPSCFGCLAASRWEAACVRHRANHIGDEPRIGCIADPGHDIVTRHQSTTTITTLQLLWFLTVAMKGEREAGGGAGSTAPERAPAPLMAQA